MFTKVQLLNATYKFMTVRGRASVLPGYYANVFNNETCYLSLKSAFVSMQEGAVRNIWFPLYAAKHA